MENVDELGATVGRARGTKEDVDAKAVEVEEMMERVYGPLVEEMKIVATCRIRKYERMGDSVVLDVLLDRSEGGVTIINEKSALETALIQSVLSAVNQMAMELAPGLGDMPDEERKHLQRKMIVAIETALNFTLSDFGLPEMADFLFPLGIQKGKDEKSGTVH
jgi:hypothetical protein